MASNTAWSIPYRCDRAIAARSADPRRRKGIEWQCRTELVKPEVVLVELGTFSTGLQTVEEIQIRIAS